MKYIAKAEVWFEINTDYADGIGEAQREIGSIVESLINRKEGIRIAHATNIEILGGKLSRKMTECDYSLTYTEESGNQIILDDGIN